jgi:hypothetical protein
LSRAASLWKRRSAIFLVLRTVVARGVALEKTQHNFLVQHTVVTRDIALEKTQRHFLVHRTVVARGVALEKMQRDFLVLRRVVARGVTLEKTQRDLLSGANPMIEGYNPSAVNTQITKKALHTKFVFSSLSKTI